MDINALFNGATEITFGALFVVLFYWTTKQNDKREKKYGERLDDKNKVISDQQVFIAQQSEMMREISETVKQTSQIVQNVSNDMVVISREVHDIKIKVEG